MVRHGGGQGVGLPAAQGVSTGICLTSDYLQSLVAVWNFLRKSLQAPLKPTVVISGSIEISALHVPFVEGGR